MSISDPSLYLDPNLNLAWFSGSHVQPDLTEVLATIIAKTAEKTRASKVVLFGGSGGGYIALQLLGHLPEATAVVMNPQTSIEKYYPAHVRSYIDFAWKGHIDHLRSAAGTTVFDSIRSAHKTAKVVYLQNSNDPFHIEGHLAPFCEHFHGTDDFLLLQDSWGKGHTPPPKKLITQTLAAVVNDDRARLTDQLGFTQL